MLNASRNGTKKYIDMSTGCTTEISCFKMRQRQQIFLVSKVSKPASIHCVQEALPPGVERGGVKLNTSLHLLLTLRMRGAILPPHHTSLYCSASLHRDTTRTVDYLPRQQFHSVYCSLLSIVFYTSNYLIRYKIRFVVG